MLVSKWVESWDDEDLSVQTGGRGCDTHTRPPASRTCNCHVHLPVYSLRSELRSPGLRPCLGKAGGAVTLGCSATAPAGVAGSQAAACAQRGCFL